MPGKIDVVNWIHRFVRVFSGTYYDLARTFNIAAAATWAHTRVRFFYGDFKGQPVMCIRCRDAHLLSPEGQQQDGATMGNENR